MTLSRSLAAALLPLALSLPATAVQTGPTTSICIGGVTRGDWDLPGPTAANPGYADGDLFLGQTTTVRYTLSADLLPSPVACVACVSGRVDGYLDDGLGTTPDYLVRGFYNGNAASGNGTFFAWIFRPGPVLSTTAAVAGKIEGKYSDPALATTPVGHYTGHWRICP